MGRSGPDRRTGRTPGTTKRPKEPPVPPVSRVADTSTNVPGRFGSRAPSSKTYDTGAAPPPPRDLSTSFAEDGPNLEVPSTVRPQTTMRWGGRGRIGAAGRIKCPKEPWCSVRRHGCKHLRRQSSEPSTPSGRTDDMGGGRSAPTRLSTTFEVPAGPPRMSSTPRPQRRVTAAGAAYGSRGQESALGPSCGTPS